MQQRKRQFGVEYFELMQRQGSNGTDEELQACIQRAKCSIAVLEQEIVKLKIAADQADEKTRRKIAKRNAKRSRQQVSQPDPLPVATPVVERNPFDSVPQEAYDDMLSDKDDCVVIPAAQVQPSAPSEELLFGHS